MLNMCLLIRMDMFHCLVFSEKYSGRNNNRKCFENFELPFYGLTTAKGVVVPLAMYLKMFLGIFVF